MVSIEPLESVSSDAVEAFNSLLKQLSTKPESQASVSAEHLQRIVEASNSVLLVAADEGKIIGTATVIWNAKPTGVFAHVEDVVVDNGYRGQGIGEKLVRRLIEIARDEGVETIELTSRPVRVAANKLYQKIGFQLKDTNCYEMDL